MAKHFTNRLLTDTFREIKNTRSRFISLMVLSALAVCFLAGLRATEPDMKNSADIYLDRQKLMDLRIVGTLGLTEQDAVALEQQPGVKVVERAYTVDALLHLPENDYIIKALSYTSTPGLNAPRLVEGRMPDRANECLVEPLLLQETGLNIGDAITLDTGKGSFENALPSPTFTIVGTANSPLYVGVERGSSSLGTGKVSAFLLLPLEAFSMEAYTDLYLQVEGMDELLCYSDLYINGMDAFKNNLEPFAQERAQFREDEIRDETNQKLDDAEAELAQGELEFHQEISDARQTLSHARKELDDGWAEYRDGHTQYKDGLKSYQDGNAKYQDGLAQYQAGIAQLEDARSQYDSAYAQYLDGVKALEDGKAELRTQQAAFDAGLNELRTSLAALDPRLTYPDNAALLSAMADPKQAALIDQTLDKARTDLQGAIDLLKGIATLRQELGDYADADLTELTRQKLQLEATLPLLEMQKSFLELRLSHLSPDDPQRAQLEAELETCLSNLAQATEGLRQLESLIEARQLLMQLEIQRDAAGLTNTTPEQLQSQLDNLYTTADGKTIPLSTAVLLSAHQQLEAGRQEIQTNEAALTQAREELAAAEAELSSGAQTLEASRLELKQAHLDLAQGKGKLDQARLELDDALAQLQEGEQEYADGLSDFESGKTEGEAKLADARKELEQARRDLDQLDESQWYLLGRNTNMGYMSYSMDADRMGNLASVFPLIFFLVAALVCLTTMTRMVEEQRTTIGGLKALGYSKWQIAVKYVGYGFLASAAGSLLGLTLGLTLIPWIICNAWNIIYQLGPIHYSLEPATSAIACLAAIGTVTLSALGACFSTLSAVPAQLMRPKAPPAGKRVLLEKLPFLWRRLSFNYKITIRNLFRYQKRFWMTVVGIGGCAALIITAFGLRGSIFDIMDIQFDEIYTHTAHVGLVDHVTPTELQEVAQVLDKSDLVNNWLACRSENVTAETSTYTVNASLQIFPHQEAVAPMIHLRHRTDDTAVVLPDDGVVLTEKLAKLLDVQAGDSFILDGEQRVEVRVADITEHYIQHYIYMNQTYYRSLFDSQCENNLILVDYPVDAPGVEHLEQDLVGLDGVTSLSRISDTRKTFSSSLASVDYAVVLIIVCAAALAFVVLYNLTNINITERMRELATLKVLGFYDGELSAYVYRENVILTIFGVAIGMLMGKLLHQWLILTVEIDLLMFGRVLSSSCYLYSIVLTVLFSLLVNLSAHKKLKKLAMVESLKTVE